MRRIVVVDDHRPFLEAACRTLQRAGWTVTTVQDPKRVPAIVAEVRPGVVLLDVQMGDASGFDIAHQLATGPHPPAVLLISARAASSYGEAVATCGARGFLDKLSFSAASVEDLLTTTAP